MKRAILTGMFAYQKTATVFGGTGFIGRQIVRVLARAGYGVKVATRVPERAYFLKPSGAPGQIVPVACDTGDVSSLARAVAGADVVVNCIGILHEKRRGDFVKLHSALPAALGKIAREAGVKRFVHLSIAGLEHNISRYAQTKYEGEKALAGAFPGATILRLSIVFGPDDDFFNKFAGLIRFLPALPLIGGGKTRFQPVYVGDVAQAVRVCVTGDKRFCGHVYELGGPKTFSFQEIYALLCRYTGRQPRFIRLPWWAAKVQAFFMGWMPTPLLTCDQVDSLKTDCVASDGALGFEALGIVPTDPEAILPAYLCAPSQPTPDILQEV